MRSVLKLMSAIVVLFVCSIFLTSNSTKAMGKNTQKSNKYENSIKSNISDPDDIQPSTKKKLFSFWKKLKATIVNQNKTAYANCFYYDEDGYNHGSAPLFSCTRKDFIVGFDDYFETWYRAKLKANKEDQDEIIYKITNEGEIRAELWLKLDYDLREYIFQIHEGNWYLENIVKEDENFKQLLRNMA